MNVKTMMFFVVLVALTGSCKNASKITKSEPDLAEENSRTEITVREEKVKPVDQSEETVYRYYVIIGSFKNLDNARKYRTDLVKDGFTPAILENENGLFRVSVGAYNDENAARLKIAGIRAAYEKYGDVWLLVRK